MAAQATKLSISNNSNVSFFFSPKEKKNNVLTTNYSGRMETHQIWFENVVKYRWNFDNSIDGILPISC